MSRATSPECAASVAAVAGEEEWEAVDSDIPIHNYEDRPVSLNNRNCRLDIFIPSCRTTCVSVCVTLKVIHRSRIETRFLEELRGPPGHHDEARSMPELPELEGP